jgi:hypothetical protein
MSVIHINSFISFAGALVDTAAITYGITSAGGTFNLRSSGTVDYEVDWGDGDVETSTLNVLPHTYAAGDYVLTIDTDDAYRPFFNGIGDEDQLTSVAIGAEADLGTDLTSAWSGANNMTSFTCPFDVTSSVTNFPRTWFQCSGLSSFPLIDTSSGTSFSSTWNGCSGLSSFVAIGVGNGTNFFRAWYGCSGLTSFPANMFDATGTLSANAFNSAWAGCALTAQSIENILVSLDTNGASNISLGIEGGTNAAKTTWSTAANTAYTNLINKGWTISFNA